MKENILKTFSSLVLILVIILGVSQLLFAQSDDGLLVSSGGKTAGSSAEREILSLLLELRSIDLDLSLFQSNVFRSLEDFGVVLESQPVGRSNPFAPIGTDKEFVSEDEAN